MSWASGKRFIIIAILALLAVAVIALVVAFSLKKEPSCSDGIQNADEAGVDCGGSCAYLCVASLSEPSVVYARAVVSGSRIDVVAYVENRNPSAGVKGARYLVEVYDANRTVLASRAGTLDLVPGAGTPIFIPDVYRGEGAVGQATLTLEKDSLNWKPYPVVQNTVRAGEIRIEGVQDAPRISATLFNPGVRDLEDITLVLTAFDAGGVVIATSQTILPNIEGEDTAAAVFTWNEPFYAEPVRIDIRPILSLP